MSDFTGKATTTSYNKDGLPVITSFQQSSANPTTNISPSITNTYDQADEISSINVSNATGSIYGFSYLRSPSGAIATETNTGASSSSSGSSSTYLYDPLSRVTQMTTNSSSSTTRTTSSYSYDPSSNLITLPNGASATYDPAGELTSSVLPGTNGSSSTYTYNANGERTSSSISTPRSSTPQIITSATWNASNELTSYTTPYVSMTFATYNGEGLRTSATFSTSSGITTREHYLYNQTSSIPNIITDSTNAYIYNSSMVPFEQINLTTGITTYLITDATGSVRAVMSASAKIEATTNYDAYGNTTTKGGLSSYTPFGFSGSYSDPTGLTYLINRYYEPSTGQFISVDPLVIQTAQPYAYTGGDPVNLSDPSGTAVFSPCYGYGSQAAVCDLTVLAHTDFPGLSPAHLALIGSVAALSVVGTAAALLIPEVLTPLSVIMPFIPGVGGTFGGAYWALSVGQPSITELHIALWGALAVVYLDEYAGKPGVHTFVQQYGLNEFFGTYEIYNPQFGAFLAGVTNRAIAGALGSIVAFFADKALPDPLSLSSYRSNVISNKDTRCSNL